MNQIKAALEPQTWVPRTHLRVLKIILKRKHCSLLRSWCKQEQGSSKYLKCRFCRKPSQEVVAVDKHFTQSHMHTGFYCLVLGFTCSKYTKPTLAVFLTNYLAACFLFQVLSTVASFLVHLTFMAHCMT